MDVALKTQLADKKWFRRLLEIIPGGVTWLFLLAPVLLSFVQPILVAYFIIAFDLFWLVKSLRLSFYLVRGYKRLHDSSKVRWLTRLRELENLPRAMANAESKIDKLLQAHPKILSPWFLSGKHHQARAKYKVLLQQLKELQYLSDRKNTILDPKDIYNVVIITLYNESLDIIEPTVQSVIDADYPKEQIILAIAYEEKGGDETVKNAQYLASKYRSVFAYTEAIMHPSGRSNEVNGKGPNITYAGRRLAKYIDEQGIDPERVIVTTLDADNRPSKNYFAHLTYVYATNINRTHKSYQPVPMFYNNIWDAPAPMRLIATGNSFWMIMESMRPHRLRNFSAHAQSLKALIDTDFWSVTTIVEDGHQYWRTYFTYDGDHQVVPLLSPVFQDAVLAEGYWKTFKVQYIQLRRWAWGASDFPYVVINAIKNRRIPWSDKLVQIGRLFEGHFSWATAPLIIAFVAWLPLLLNPEFSKTLLAHQLPIIASRIMTVAMVGLVITVLISLMSLPPKPARYSGRRTIAMVFQWLLLPLTGILFSASAAIDAQTRLMLGKSLNWVVTEKAVRK